MKAFLTISEVAQRTGLSVDTLRYYERAGLIAPVPRAAGGQRRYAAADLDWIGFLLRLRKTHMPVAQMQIFAQLRSQGDATMPVRRQMLEQHLEQVLSTIAAMQHSAQTLEAKIAFYRAGEASLQTTPPSEGNLHANHCPSRQQPL